MIYLCTRITFHLGCALFNASQGYDIQTRTIFYKEGPCFNICKDLPIKGRQLTCLDWGLYLDFEMFTKNINVCKIGNCIVSWKNGVSASDDHFMK